MCSLYYILYFIFYFILSTVYCLLELENISITLILKLNIVTQQLTLLSAWFIYTLTVKAESRQLGRYLDRQNMQDIYLDRYIHVGYILRQIVTCRIYTQTDKYIQDRYLDKQIHVGYILGQIDTCKIDTQTDKYMQSRN